MDELSDVAEAFNMMADELEKSFSRQKALERSRRDLVAAVSHDLRTPLASVRAIVEALADGMVYAGQQGSARLRDDLCDRALRAPLDGQQLRPIVQHHLDRRLQVAADVGRPAKIHLELETGGVALVALILVSSLMAVVYVWRIVETAYFGEPANDEPAPVPAALVVILWAVAVANIVFGIAPELPLSLSTAAADILLGHVR